jgi:hypothetical protein
MYKGDDLALAVTPVTAGCDIEKSKAHHGGTAQMRPQPKKPFKHSATRPQPKTKAF